MTNSAGNPTMATCRAMSPRLTPLATRTGGTAVSITVVQPVGFQKPAKCVTWGNRSSGGRE
jgi:hypothetical protein